MAPLIHIHSEKQIITQIAVVLSTPGEEAAAAINGNTGPKAGEDAGSLWRVGDGDVILGAEKPARSKLLTRNHENVDFGKGRGDTIRPDHSGEKTTADFDEHDPRDKDGFAQLSLNRGSVAVPPPAAFDGRGGERVLCGRAPLSFEDCRVAELVPMVVAEEETVRRVGPVSHALELRVVEREVEGSDESGDFRFGFEGEDMWAEVVEVEPDE